MQEFKNEILAVIWRYAHESDVTWMETLKVLSEVQIQVVDLAQGK